MSLRLASLDHRFGPHRALQDVSIHVRRGDCYGLVGHNGAGKTTTMRIALGLLRSRPGHVFVDGFDAARHPRSARMLMGAMIETPAFYRDVSGFANLALLARLQGMSRLDARREADRLLEIVGLAEHRRKRFGAYSQGMRQRLGLAQTLIGNPPYLLLDEPTNGLDPEGVADVRRLLRRLVDDEGRTILISSHLLQELAGLCNRIGVIREGRLLVEETMTELLEEEGRRYTVATDDDDAARGLLETRGLTIEPGNETGDGLRVELGEQPPGDVARALVQADLALRAFAPRPPTLEEVYLHWTGRSPDETTPSTVPVSTDDSPETAAAPPPAPRPILRVLGHELRRARGRFILLALPAGLAVISVIRRHAEAEATARRAAEEGLFSTTSVTAFESVGWALHTSLPLLVVLIAGFASQSIAGERTRGTLRHLLLRPVRRVQLAAGKACATLASLGLAYALMTLTALIAAGVAFDYADLTQMLLTGEPMPVATATADVMWPRLWRVLAAPVLPLTVYAGVGFLAGAVTRSAAGALAVALAAVISLDLLRPMAYGYGVEAWLPSSHLPSVLGDSSSYVRYYIDTAQGVSDALFEHGRLAVVVPLLWSVVTFVAAGIVTTRRSEQ